MGLMNLTAHLHFFTTPLGTAHLAEASELRGASGCKC
jgi:hypothetical protein